MTEKKMDDYNTFNCLCKINLNTHKEGFSLKALASHQWQAS